jgi:hypothetical protein
MVDGVTRKPPGCGCSEPPLPSICALTTSRDVFAADSLQTAGAVAYRTTKSRRLPAAENHVKYLRFQYVDGQASIMRQ